MFVRFEKKEELSGQQFERELINRFIDSKGKTIFAEHVAEYVIRHRKELSSEISEVINRIEKK